ncbi:MAG: acetoacetate--CoA ligase [Rhodospirillaceae bacterium]|nr:acetoacetate--CoA ligase [Rhodospirillaceae bacterium]
MNRDILWRPDPARAAATNIAALARGVGFGDDDYGALHAWSVAQRDRFWDRVWTDCGVIGARGDVVIENPDAMPGARWFPQARLNYAENLLRPRPDDAEALVFRGEDGSRRSFTFGRLRDEVSRVARALADCGVGRGDRLAAFMPHCPEAVIAMLAAASRGAIFSSASPDFGAAGALDRFGQIDPKVLFAVDGYRYAGKAIGVLDKVKAIAGGLPGLTRVIVAPFLAAEPPVLDGIDKAMTWSAAIAPFESGPIDYARVPFDHPLFILYSSGTTGAPKCIVHGHGGTLLQHLKEHRYHCDIRPGDRVFYFTTLGWMMWNWLVTALASGATLILYDGSPTHPDTECLFAMAAAERVTLFGTSAKFIDAVKKAGLAPGRRHDLGALRTLCSTGSPLAPDSFDFIHESVKSDLHLASMSGGTDILGCFVTGVPTLPVRRGEIQAAALGMATDVFDDAGRPMTGATGELVCTAPFPSMPVGFWNDPGDAKYRAAYFARFANVWCHGDWAERSVHGGFVIHGRSDATLNPGGVRIGTAEIYRQVETVAEVMEAIAVGQDWDGDVRVVLFVVLAPGAALTEALEKSLRERIRANCSPRHVPARIVQVPEIPRTKSGKIVELAVRDVIHGRPVKNVEALANPDALSHFMNRPELAR